MDKQLIERAIRATAAEAPKYSEAIVDDESIRFFAAVLTRIDAERGKDAVAWLHESRREADVITTAVKNVWGGVAVGNMAAYSIPLFLSPTPTIPKGMVLVPIEATDGMISDACDVDDSFRVDVMRHWDAMIAAAQGERK